MSEKENVKTSEHEQETQESSGKNSDAETPMRT
jgi:hypothetical protein